MLQSKVQSCVGMYIVPFVLGDVPAVPYASKHLCCRGVACALTNNITANATMTRAQDNPISIMGDAKSKVCPQRAFALKMCYIGLPSSAEIVKLLFNG